MTSPKQKPKMIAAPEDLLRLNPNEGRFLNVLPLPPGGWFNFGEHGNPPYDIPVEVRMKDNLLTHEAIGIRTRALALWPATNTEPERLSEKWIIAYGDHAKSEDDLPTGLLTHWRPRQDRQGCALPLRFEPPPPTLFRRIEWLIFG